MASFFDRSKLDWDGHIGEQPKCIPRPCRLGKGYYRTIHFTADKSLTAQIVRQIEANKSRFCFPALDAVLEVRLPMRKARELVAEDKDTSPEKMDDDVGDNSAIPGEENEDK